MDRLLRLWLRAALILALTLGCNAVAIEPALADDASPVIHMATGCHGSSHGGGVSISCHSCQAIPVPTARVEPPVLAAHGFAPSALPLLAGSAFRPAIPPPRPA